MKIERYDSLWELCNEYNLGDPYDYFSEYSISVDDHDKVILVDIGSIAIAEEVIEFNSEIYHELEGCCDNRWWLIFFEGRLCLLGIEYHS